MGQITLWGMNEYLDNTLFQGLVLPTGMANAILINRILRIHGQQFPIHQVPERLKENIGYWSQGRLQAWTKIWEALQAEYNPIENFDRHEDRHYQEKGSDVDAEIIRNKNVTTPDDTTTTNESVSAYDSSSYNPREQTSTTRSGKITGETEGSDTVTKTFGRGTDENSHLHGNIGVTTNQQMITSEIILRTTYDVYRIIGNEFEDEFLICVY